MKKGGVVVLVLIVALVLVVVLLNINKFTGNATLTPNANYAPIETNSNAYHSCSYVVKSDGWDVTRTSKIEYFDRLAGEAMEVIDYCASETKVKEYDCKSGFMVERSVICPPKMICSDGSCIYG